MPFSMLPLPQFQGNIASQWEDPGASSRSHEGKLMETHQILIVDKRDLPKEKKE
jgi:hypothetical protein